MWMQSAIAKVQIILGAISSLVPVSYPAAQHGLSGPQSPSPCREQSWCLLETAEQIEHCQCWKTLLDTHLTSGDRDYPHKKYLVVTGKCQFAQSCGCCNTAHKDDSNDPYAIPHYKMDIFIQSRRSLNFRRLTTARRFFNNKAPLYFAILRGRNIPEYVLAKLEVW